MLINVRTQRCDIGFGKILDSRIRIDAGFLENLGCRRTTDTEDICETDLNTLILREVNTSDSSHIPNYTSKCAGYQP
jgi:hypothetical protein